MFSRRQASPGGDVQEITGYFRDLRCRVEVSVVVCFQSWVCGGVEVWRGGVAE